MASRSIARSCARLSTTTPSSATQAFLQLTPRRFLHSAPPVLEFLLPNALARASYHGLGRQFKSARMNTAKRTFTFSAARGQEAFVISNPQKDDDGKEMTIQITPRASKRLSEIMAKDKNPNLALRITVSSGGCHGFQYAMSLITLPSHLTSNGEIQEEFSPALNTSSSDPNALPTGNTTNEIKEEDSPALNTSSSDPNAMPTSTSSKGTKTEKVVDLEEDDVVFGAADGSGAMVVLDGPSLEYLKDSKVHYTEELIGSQFVITDNPLATSSCGCGTSFDIKV